MKKVIVISFVVLLTFLPAFLLINSCGSDKCVIPTEPEYYHIRFTLDGAAIDAQDIILNFNDANGPALALIPSNDWMEMNGWYCGGGTTASFTTFRLWVRLSFFTPGVYEGVYGGPGPSIGVIEIRLTIIEDDIEYDYFATDGTVTITSFGNVNGDVVGTLSLTFGTANPAPSFSAPLTATGEFRVLRLSDQ